MYCKHCGKEITDDSKFCRYWVGGYDGWDDGIGYHSHVWYSAYTLSDEDDIGCLCRFGAAKRQALGALDNRGYCYYIHVHHL